MEPSSFSLNEDSSNGSFQPWSFEDLVNKLSFGDRGFKTCQLVDPSSDVQPSICFIVSPPVGYPISYHSHQMSLEPQAEHLQCTDRQSAQSSKPFRVMLDSGQDVLSVSLCLQHLIASQSS